MSHDADDSFDLNMLRDAPPPARPDAPKPPPPPPPAESADDAASFRTQMAGGSGSDFVLTPTPQKASALTNGPAALALAAAVAAGGLYLMHRRSAGPADAAAGEPASVAARENVRGFLVGDGEGSARQVREALADAASVAARFRADGQGRQVPLAMLKTNPFWQEEAAVDADAPPAEVVESRRRERDSREKFDAALSALQLQSIFFGREPTCMIDGRSYRVGWTVGDFEIAAIRRDAVELRAEGGWTGELRMSVE